MEVAIPKQIVGGCLRKLPYFTRKVAKDAASAAAKKFGHRLRVYRCEHCGMFHITSQK